MRLTCDTTATDSDGNVHAVVFVGPAPGWVLTTLDGLDLGDTVTMVDQATGVETTGTIASFEASRDVENPTATRVELVITPD